MWPDHLKATGPIEALKMAMKNRLYPKSKLMHYSDKGIQYCCDAYIQILKNNKIEISMTSKYDPYENAKAERVNGTIKNEFELDKLLPDIRYATREITKTIKIYNQLRPHLGCRMHTPDQMHQHINPNPKKLETNKMWERIFLDNFNE
jgi:transposase InsO family protein